MRSERCAKTAFYRVCATAEWLQLTPVERDEFVTRVLRPILARYPAVRLRYFDAEAYSAITSDVLMWEIESEPQYRSLVEALRETAFWGRYFTILEILVTVEDGFAAHYGFEGFARSRKGKGAERCG